MNDTQNDGITIGLGELEQRLYQSLLQQCQLEYQLWLQDKLPKQPEAPDWDWIDFLKIRIGQEMSMQENLRRLHQRFLRSVNTSSSAEDRQQLVLNFARDLGATPAQLERDADAFSRWFGADAVMDRYHRRRARREQYMAFLLDRLAAVAATMARGVGDTREQQAFWKRLALESVVKPLLDRDGDVRLELAAFRCLAGVLAVLDPEIQELAVDDTTLRYIYRSALQPQQAVWIQSAALELLVTLSRDSFESVLRQRLLQPAPGDDLFVRRRAVQLMARHFHRLDGSCTLIPALLSDPSPSVRQALPKVMIQAPASDAVSWFEHLIVGDPSPQVRAATWLEWPGLLADPEFREHALRLFRETGTQETDEFVLRVICLVAERGARQLRLRSDPFLAEWQSAAFEVLIGLRCGAASVKVRRWASRSLEFVWSECHPSARTLRDQFAAFARSIPPGRKRRLPASLTEDLDPAFVGRVWSIICRDDYSVQLRATGRGFQVTRGHAFGFRWWRWWHELRHPSPDKRQAFPHTIGRLFDGELHIPSGIMAELAQTKVPGEPLHIAEEGGWRPYLPLLDELTSSVEFGQGSAPFRIFTSEGITTVKPPRGWKRWHAAFNLTWRFRDYAEKRNWLDTQQEPASAYIAALAGLGFDIRFATYPDPTGRPMPADPMVQRFFLEADGASFDQAAGLEAEAVAERIRPAAPEPVVALLHEQPESQV